MRITRSRTLSKDLRLYRLGTWGDRKHWELTIGRLCISRWCGGAPCHLADKDGHPIRVHLWNRAGWASRR